MALKFRRGTTAQQSGSLAFGEPYVNTTLGTLLIGGPDGDIVLGTSGTGSTGNFGAISGSGLDITGNANIAGNLTLGGQLTIGDATSDTVNVVASLSSSLIPQSDSVYDLGSATKSWKDLYVSTGSIKFVANGTVVSTLSTNANGSQNFPNGVNITGSIIASGSNIEFIRDWPAVGSESHFLRLAPFTSSTGRYYDGLGIGVEHWDDGTGTYEHALQIHSFDNHDSPNYGAELNVGPFRTHMRAYPSGSAGAGGHLANISVQDLQNGKSQALVYGDFVQIGNFIGQFITIGNSGSVVEISGSVRANITGSIAATNGVVSGSSQITLSSTTGFSAYSTSVDSRITTEKGRVDAILLAADADKDSFAEIVTLINSVDITNDSTFASFYTASVGRLNNLESTSASVNISVSNLNTYTGSNDVTNGTQNTRLTALEASASTALSTNNTQATSITNLNSATASLLIETANLETFSSSALTRLTTLEVETANLESFTSSINTTIKTRLNAETVVSGSSQITLSSTTGYGTVINQNLLTTSNVQHASLGIGMAASGTSGRIDAANDIVAFSTSDIRFKENITPIENAIDKIRKISGNTYDWKSELKDIHGYEGNDVGVIAQEVEAVLPQLVQNRDNGYKAVKYDKLVALLIEGIKEQQLQIEQLRIDLNNCTSNKGL